MSFFQEVAVGFEGISHVVRRRRHYELDDQGPVLSPSAVDDLRKFSHFVFLSYVKLKLGSQWPGELSVTSDRQMTSFLWQKAKRS